MSGRLLPGVRTGTDRPSFLGVDVTDASAAFGGAVWLVATVGFGLAPVERALALAPLVLVPLGVGAAATPRFEGVPDSVVETVEANRERDLHTLVYLDIKIDDPHWEGEEEFMTADHAADLLAEEFEDTLGVVVARAGSATPTVEADVLEELADGDFGGPLHLLVIPGELHDMERDALRELAGAPDDAL